MKFSERVGLKPMREAYQIDSVDAPLLNGIWNVLYTEFLKKMDTYNQNDQSAHLVARIVWCDYYKNIINSLEDCPARTFNKVLQIALKNDPWYSIYDFCDYIVSVLIDNRAIIKSLNDVLVLEKSGYRFVSGQLVPITNELELSSLDQSTALKGVMAPVANHLSKALELLSNRSNPDFRNSIKESILSVEAVCNIVCGTSVELGKALLAVEQKGIITHGAITKAFRSLYGFTSDAEGIRHALLETSAGLDLDDAKFMLVSCSAFVNLIASRANMVKGTKPTSSPP